MGIIMYVANTCRAQLGPEFCRATFLYSASSHVEPALDPVDFLDLFGSRGHLRLQIDQYIFCVFASGHFLYWEAAVMASTKHMLERFKRA